MNHYVIFHLKRPSTDSCITMIIDGEVSAEDVRRWVATDEHCRRLAMSGFELDEATIWLSTPVPRNQ